MFAHETKKSKSSFSHAPFSSDIQCLTNDDPNVEKLQNAMQQYTAIDLDWMAKDLLDNKHNDV